MLLTQHQREIPLKLINRVAQACSLSLLGWCASGMVAAEYQPKISNKLQQQLATVKSDQTINLFIYFKDKGDQLEAKLAAARNNLSPATLKRRSINLSAEKLVSYRDIPIETKYLDWLTPQVNKVRHKLKTLNAVSVEATPSQVKTILASDWVAKVEIVKRLNRPQIELKANDIRRAEQKSELNVKTQSMMHDYGTSLTQNQQINVPAVHELGYDGSGVVVALFDSGFNRLTHESFAQINIVDTWDFVNNDENVGDHNDTGTGSHGTNTLSTIAGFSSGNLIGPAYGASYYLAKTENNESETHVEEDNWCAATEWAEQNGVQIISSSLGYTDFDSGVDYTWQDMDGDTTIVTQCADIAAENGIVVINSAGNNGPGNGQNTIGAPSDGHFVLAVGAVTSNGQRSSFSSVGPSADGRIKPDIAAMGTAVTVASSVDDSGYISVNGTSFACPLTSGVAALMLQANPNLSATKVREILRNTADGAASPDTLYGYGIVDALAAVNHALAEISGNQSPIASFTATTSSDQSASFSNASTDSDGSIVSYLWDFDDGQTSTEENPSHSYTNHGTYTVGLTVTDDGGLSSTTSRVISFQAPSTGGNNEIPESSSSGGGGAGNAMLTMLLLLTARRRLIKK